jgi:hypothetical protein
MPSDKVWLELIKSIPLQKLRRYEVANLLFEAIALFFTSRFCSHHPYPVLCMMLIACVLAMGFLCIRWACNQ